MNELERIVETARELLIRRRERFPVEMLAEQAEARRAAGDERSFADALRRPGVSVIAEHKRRSPSAGTIREDLELGDVVKAYERGGASALSVLTEESRFGGSLADLAGARYATSLPILRKEFVVDRYQVLESYAAGADAILLIVAALDGEELGELHAYARELGLDVLVEVHDEPEVARAARIGAPVIGINNRDLATLQVDTRRTFELLPMLPEGTIKVAESGFSRASELVELASAGVDAVLIGEALMRAPDVEAACRELVSGAAAPRV